MRLIIFLLCLGLATAAALFYLDTTDEDVHRAIEHYSQQMREQTKQSGEDTGDSVEGINERLQKLREEAKRMRLKANEALGEGKEELAGRAEGLGEKARKLAERAAEIGEKAAAGSKNKLSSCTNRSNPSKKNWSENWGARSSGRPVRVRARVGFRFGLDLRPQPHRFPPPAAFPHQSRAKTPPPRRSTPLE